MQQETGEALAPDDYLQQHHRILRVLDEGRDEEENLAESLLTLITRDYGQAPNALMELVTQMTDDVNDNHHLNLVLDITKAGSSTQDNLDKHLSKTSLQLDPSEPDVPKASLDKTYQPR